MRRPLHQDPPSLQAMLEFGAEAHPSFVSEVSLESPPGLLTARSLTDGSVNLADVIGQFQKECGFRDSRVAGMLFVARFSWFAAGAVMTLVSANRLPHIRQRNVDFVLNLAAKQSRCLIRSETVFVLPHDPYSTNPEARIVSSIEDLHQELAYAFVEVINPVVEAAATNYRVGRRGLWAMAAASLGNAFLAAGRQCGRIPDAIGHMHSVMGHDHHLLRSAPVPFSVDSEAGGVHLCRAACCLVLNEPGHGVCPTSCPLLSEEERRTAVNATVVR